MSIYVSETNRQRLSDIPRGQKTALINRALDRELNEIEKDRNFDRFLQKVMAIKPVKMPKSSEEMVRELRETGAISVPRRLK